MPRKAISTNLIFSFCHSALIMGTWGLGALCLLWIRRWWKSSSRAAGKKSRLSATTTYAKCVASASNSMHEKRQEISTLVAPAAAAVGSLVAADSVYQIPLDIVRCTAEPRQGPRQRCGVRNTNSDPQYLWNC